MVEMPGLSHSNGLNLRMSNKMEKIDHTLGNVKMKFCFWSKIESKEQSANIMSKLE